MSAKEPPFVQEKELRHNESVNISHGIIQSLATSIFQPFLGIFAIRLGASNAQVALLSSLPALMSIISMIPGALFLRRFPMKKRITGLLFLANRVFMLLAALVPLFSRDSRAAWLVVLVGFMNLPGAVANIAWQTLMGDIFPADRRGTVFALRNQWATLVSFAPTLIAGWALDVIRFPVGYQVLFALAFVISLVEVLVFTRLRETQPEEQSIPFAPKDDPSPLPARMKGEWNRVRTTPAYIRYNACSLLFQFGWQMGWPLFTIYQVKYLGANNVWTAWFSVTSGIASFASYRWWGRYADRVGNMRGMVLATLGMAINPVFYVLSDRLWMIALFNLSMGFFVAGTVLLLFNSLLEIVPPADRTNYIAYNNTLIQMSATIAPFVGNWFGEWLGIKEALLVTAGVRALGSLAFAHMVGLWPFRRTGARPNRALGMGPE